jgi:hypothetical protein
LEEKLLVRLRLLKNEVSSLTEGGDVDESAPVVQEPNMVRIALSIGFALSLSDAESVVPLFFLDITSSKLRIHSRADACRLSLAFFAIFNGVLGLLAAIFARIMVNKVW